MSALIGLDTNDEHCPLVLTRVGNGGGNVQWASVVISGALRSSRYKGYFVTSDARGA
jgi:hypothetical protein